MDAPRTSKAMARIETALTRIERATAAISDSPPPAAPSPDPALIERNRELEDTLRGGLGELDRIIERLER